MRILSIDIETRSDVDLPLRGVYNYVNTAFFRLLWFSYSYDNGAVQTIDMWANPVLPDFIIADLQDPEVIKCAANATFERVCLSRVLGIYLPPEQWQCTLVLAGRNGLPMHLDGAAFHSKVHIQKDAGGKELINTFSIPQQISKTNPWQQWINPEHAPEKWQLYGRYNNTDVGAEMAVKQANSWMPVSQVEHQLYALDQRINDRGMKIDRVFIQQAMALGAQFKAETSNRMIELTGIKNPRSVQQLIKWLNEETDLEPMAKIPAKSVQKLVEKLDIEIGGDTAQTLLLTAPTAELGMALAKAPAHVVKEVLECRLMLGKASISKYAAMNKVLGWDDRVRGVLFFYGASATGRWAGRGFQPHNFTKHKIKDETGQRDLLLELRTVIRSGRMEEVRAMHPNIADALSQCVRTAIIADVGKQFLISDYSAIEARVTAWLANEMWRLDFFHRGGDIYVESVCRMLKINMDSLYEITPEGKRKLTHEGKRVRAIGKVAELALGFLGGVGALKSMCASLGIYLPEQDMQPIVDAFRQANPAIVDFGADMERAALRAMLQPGTYQVAGVTRKIQFLYAKGNLYMILPSGRWLCYQQAFIGTGKFGGPGIQYYQSKNKGWMLVSTYSGKLLENAVQATARDLLAGGMLRLDRAGFDIVLHVHDEVVVEEPILGRSIEEVNHLMCQKSVWYADLPFEAAGFVAPFYKKDDN